MGALLPCHDLSPDPFIYYALSLSLSLSLSEYKKVICARGLRAWNHSGNRKLRAMIESKNDIYSQAQTKLQRTDVVTDIVETFRRKGAGFVRQEGNSTSNGNGGGDDNDDDENGGGEWCKCIPLHPAFCVTVFNSSYRFTVRITSQSVAGILFSVSLFWPRHLPIVEVGDRLSREKVRTRLAPSIKLC